MISPTQWTTGYCTNVHAGTDMNSICDNLERYAGSARIQSGLDTLGVGLWLPKSAATELKKDVAPFAKFLSQRHLVPYNDQRVPVRQFFTKPS